MESPASISERWAFGVCGGPEVAAIAARAGFDFAEWNVEGLLKPRQPDSVFKAHLETLRAAALPYPVANGFLPPDLKVTGPEANPEKLRSFVETALGRAQQLGLEVIVFGSGGARHRPEGWEVPAAWEQLVAFCAAVGPLAEAHGVTIAVEPLHSGECNILNTLEECAALVGAVSHPRIRLLVDAYHLVREGEPWERIVRHGHLLVHAHLATAANRRSPGVEPCDFRPFFEALRETGYRGRISIESMLQDAGTELEPARVLLDGLAESTGHATP